ncbi:hypothetical protein GCM10008090_27450 [Arenicella chitinivorans]|uniref:DUF2007 domain-containing protein n=1 Tax=Arenicella chitinivorans TaxID=1329800 RepID=A0A918RXC5_9GAMM|nr:DUF2007 domain-containing protein [Arenicella chitinivorans]GHA16160.1 hypothetical protein GCM10008090_27450 [Arenicella chitinivorans]
MVVLCHAMDDMEVLFLRALLQSEDIHFAIVGEHFGSLYPGVQIASYNERRFLVPFEEYVRAAALIAEHRTVVCSGDQRLICWRSSADFYRGTGVWMVCPRWTEK